MEKISRKPIVIEFNGLPGSGKTTTLVTMRGLLKKYEVIELSGDSVRTNKWTYQEIMGSKEIRKVFFSFLKAFFLIHPITWERWKLTKRTFGYWYGIQKSSVTHHGKPRICILDEGIIQGFVSMAYKGTIRDKAVFLDCIKSIMESLDNVICVNCITDVNVSKERMRARKNKWSRLDAIQDDEELLKALLVQKKQFEAIRKKAISLSISIDMNDSAEQNAKKIIKNSLEMVDTI